MFRHKLFKNLYDTYLSLIGNVVTAVCQTKLYEKEIVSLSVLLLFYLILIICNYQEI